MQHVRTAVVAYCHDWPRSVAQLELHTAPAAVLPLLRSCANSGVSCMNITLYRTDFTVRFRDTTSSWVHWPRMAWVSSEQHALIVR